MRAVALAFLLASCAAPAATGPARVRIVGVTAYEVWGERYSVVAPNAYAATRPRAVKEHLAVIRTDRAGLEGYGVAPRNLPAAASKLVGMDPRDFFRFEGGRIVGLAPEHESLAYELRGMDLAILDLVGKLLGKPVAELWGPPARAAVDVYDSSLYFEDLLEGKDLQDYPFRAENPVDRVAQKAAWSCDRGVRVLKLKVGRAGRMKGDPAGVVRDIEVVRAVRKAVGPDVRLFVDGNDGYKGRPEWVVQFVEGVRDCGIFAFEEMLPEAGYAALRERLGAKGLSVVLADGEGLRDFSPAWEEAYLKTGLVGICQPDLNTFGILGARRWGEAAARHGARLVCHNFGTNLGVYGAVHLALSLPNSDLVEADDSVFPQFNPVGFSMKEGRCGLTGRPGLGIEVTLDPRSPPPVLWRLP